MYAANTKVSVDKSQAEIKKVLAKYKATSFMTAETPEKASIAFEMNYRRIRFVFNRPSVSTEGSRKRIQQSVNHLEQEERRLWRCLVLAIKSKLESVESGIATFEQEFLANIVLSNGKTMGDVAIPQIAKSYENNEMPSLLGYEEK